MRASVSVEEIESKSVKAGSRIEGQEAGGSRLDAIQSSKVDSVKVCHEILAQLYASLATSFVSVVLIFGL